MIETELVHGHRYFVCIVDAFTRYTVVRSIRSEVDASDAVLCFVKFFQRRGGCTVKRVHTDGGSEFIPALSQLKGQGVQVSVTTAFISRSNGLAERTHQNVLALARTRLKQAKLPHRFWNYAVRHGADYKNMVSRSVAESVPLQVLARRLPSEFVHIRPFGCAMSSCSRVK